MPLLFPVWENDTRNTLRHSTPGVEEAEKTNKARWATRRRTLTLTPQGHNTLMDDLVLTTKSAGHSKTLLAKAKCGIIVVDVAASS